MEGKWTAGPWAEQYPENEWSADNDGENTVAYICAAGRDDPICMVVEGAAYGRDSILNANANLIAASPTMAEALVEAERFLDYFVNERRDFTGPGTPQAALEQVRQALSQALGEPS